MSTTASKARRSRLKDILGGRTLAKTTDQEIIQSDQDPQHAAGSSSGRSSEPDTSMATETPSNVSKATNISTNPTSMSNLNPNPPRGPTSYTSPTVGSETHRNNAGQIVTTTTTTTTTTSTITGTDGVKTTIEQPRNDATEMPTGAEPPTQVEKEEQISETLDKPPSPVPEMISPVTPVKQRFPAPPVPERHARRSLEGYQFSSQAGPQDDPYPSGHPTIHEPPESGVPPGDSRPQNGLASARTLDNLKRAAAGVHGAGDLLRGTFNSTIDRRFHDPDSLAIQKNESVLERGRYETENQQFHPNGAMPPLHQIHESQEPVESTEPSYIQSVSSPQPASGRSRSVFSGMFRKDKSPGMGPSEPPRKLKKPGGAYVA